MTGREREIMLGRGWVRVRVDGARTKGKSEGDKKGGDKEKEKGRTR